MYAIYLLNIPLVYNILNKFPNIFYKSRLLTAWRSPWTHLSESNGGTLGYSTTIYREW